MEMAYPELPNTVGKRGKSVMPPDGKVVNFTVVDEVRSFQDSTREKVLVMQLVELDSGKKEVRVGYYIIGKLPRMKGKWVWGQYAAFMPLAVFRRLITMATRRGWFPSPRAR
jgi:hypothetical protein